MKTGGWGGSWVEVPAPARDWAHGVWEALAITLDAPLRKAFQDHLGEHGCTWARPDGVLADCQVAWDLFHLTADGRWSVAIGGLRPPGTVVPEA